MGGTWKAESEVDRRVRLEMKTGFRFFCSFTIVLCELIRRFQHDVHAQSTFFSLYLKLYTTRASSSGPGAVVVEQELCYSLDMLAI